MDISCIASGHIQVKELRYSIKKCSFCKKRCLFRTRKMVKCIACKCTVHKRCLAAARSELRDNVEPNVANGQWDGDVIPEIETKPMEKLSAEVLSLVGWAPEAANKPTEEIREDNIQPAIDFPALSFAPVVIKARKPTKLHRPAVAFGHLPLLRLHLIDAVSRVFGPAPVQIQLRREILMAAACRLRLVQLQAAVCPSINLPSSALKTIIMFAVTKDKATDEIHEYGTQLVIAPSASTIPVIKARKSTEQYRSAVAFGHLPLLRLRLMDKISRVFGPAPVQIQLRRNILIAATSRLRLIQLTPIAPPITPYIKPPSPSPETITAFDCLKLVWDSLSSEKKEFQANVQRPNIAPTPLFVENKLTVLNYPKLSEPRLFKRIRYNDIVIAPPVIPSIKPPSLDSGLTETSLETITAFDCLKLVWGSLSSEEKKNLKQTFKD